MKVHLIDCLQWFKYCFHAIYKFSVFVSLCVIVCGVIRTVDFYCVGFFLFLFLFNLWTAGKTFVSAVTNDGDLNKEWGRFEDSD